MTNEEAYKWLYVHFAPCGDETKQDEAINIALKAIAKQVPKKPVMGYAFAEKIREVIKRTDHERAESKTECCPIQKEDFMSIKISGPVSNTKLSINVANDTVIETAEKLEMMAKLLRKLAHGEADEDGNVNINKRVEYIGIFLEHEEWHGNFSFDLPLIASMLKIDYKNGHSETTVKFLKDFADFAKSNKTFAEFGRKYQKQNEWIGKRLAEEAGNDHDT